MQDFKPQGQQHWSHHGTLASCTVIAVHLPGSPSRTCLAICFARTKTACCSIAHIQISCPPGALLASAARHDALTAAATGVLSALRSQGMFSGWRDELYPVSSAFDAQPALLLERAAAPYFGIRAYGVHINGYVCKGDGQKLLWVARRSRSKPTWPGLLDHIVAGGQVRGQMTASYAL